MMAKSPPRVPAGKLWIDRNVERRIEKRGLKMAGLLYWLCIVVNRTGVDELEMSCLRQLYLKDEKEKQRQTKTPLSAKKGNKENGSSRTQE
jgi:hypothetical protein